ncbi:hypothetical protein MRY82_05225 [bacterium]|nr:hypothetical protein [bacterium]
MKKVMIALIAGFVSLTYAEERYMVETNDRDVQVGAVFLMPYQLSEPEGSTASLFGARGEIFPDPTWSVGVEAIFGVEDKGFDENPLYVTPLLNFYPGANRAIEPVVNFGLPILLNTSEDNIGVRGGLGLMTTLGDTGLGLKYSFDVNYFFDQDVLSLNIVNLALNYSF